jgi:hypothetical protein
MQMESLIQMATIVSPGLELHANGKITISGPSIMNDPFAFYEDTFNWLQKYSSNPATITRINLNVSDLNPTSELVFTNLFKVFNRLALNRELSVNCIWTYDAHEANCKSFIIQLEKEMKAMNFILQPKTFQFAH